MVDTLWQVVAAYVFALVGGWISTSLQLAHKPLCALISFAAGTLLGVTIFAILPESLGRSSGGRWLLAFATWIRALLLHQQTRPSRLPCLRGQSFRRGRNPTFQRNRDRAELSRWQFTARRTVWPWEFNGKRRDGQRRNGRCSLALCIHKVPEGLALGQSSDRRWLATAAPRLAG